MSRNEVDYDIRTDQIFDIGQVQPFEAHVSLGLLCRLLRSLQKGLNL